MQLPSCVAISVNGDEIVVPASEPGELAVIRAPSIHRTAPARRDTYKNAKSEDRPVRMLVREWQ